jgi:hypothetical protein
MVFCAVLLNTNKNKKIETPTQPVEYEDAVVSLNQVFTHPTAYASSSLAQSMVSRGVPQTIYDTTSSVVQSMVSAGVPQDFTLSFFLYKTSSNLSTQPSSPGYMPSSLIVFGTSYHTFRQMLQVDVLLNNVIQIRHRYNTSNITWVNTTGSLTSTLSSNNWNHVFVSYEASTMTHKLYINGTEIAMTLQSYHHTENTIYNWDADTELFEIGSNTTIHGAYDIKYWWQDWFNTTDEKIANVTLYYSVIDITKIHSFVYEETGAGLAIKQILTVAVGQGTNTLAFSRDDGETWTGLGNILFSTGYSIDWNGTLWVAGGQGTNTLAYSSDGEIWYGLGNDIFEYARDFAWNGTRWVAVGQGPNTLAHSSDGKIWYGLGNDIFSYAFGVTWNGTLFVAGGGGENTLAYSSDGLTWYGLGKNIFTIWASKAAWNGTQWVAAGAGTNTLAYSSDGMTWNGLGYVVAGMHDGWGVAWNGTIWVATGRGSTTTLAYSSDGKDWIGLGNNIFSTRGFGISWNGTRFVAAGVGTNSLAYSRDGKDWTGLGKNIFSTEAMGIGSNGGTGV